MLCPSRSGRFSVSYPDGLCLCPVETDSTVSRFPLNYRKLWQLGLTKQQRHTFAYGFYGFILTTGVWGLRHYSDKFCFMCGTLCYCLWLNINKLVFYRYLILLRWVEWRNVLHYIAFTVMFITCITTLYKSYYFNNTLKSFQFQCKRSSDFNTF